MPLFSSEVPNIPAGLPEDVADWLEKTLREHYEDIKAIHNKLLFENWRLEQDETTGNYKVMEWNPTTETWDDTGEELVASS